MATACGRFLWFLIVCLSIGMAGCSVSQDASSTSSGTGTIQVSGLPQGSITPSSQGQNSPSSSNGPETGTNLPTPGASVPAPQEPQPPATGTGSGTSSSSPTSGSGGGRSTQTDVMLFIGNGTWGAEIKSLKDILTSNKATYKALNSSQLDALSVDEIAQFGALVFPGGSGKTEAGSLTAETHARLREAVQQRGVGYAGFCAGAFISQAPAPAAGKDVSYGLGLVDGPILGYYRPSQGGGVVMTLHTFADGSTKDILWYGGPVTPNTPGGVIAKYPNGKPAISETWSGKGLVVVAGTHPTATEATLSSLGMKSSDGVHLDVAWQMINAAIRQQPMPAFQSDASQQTASVWPVAGVDPLMIALTPHAGHLEHRTWL